MEELYPAIFDALRLAKVVYDAPRLRPLWESLKNIPLDEDSIYELEMESATSVFQDTGIYYNEESNVETWVMRDPVIDRLASLCARLEREKDLPEGINPYRRQAEQVIHEAFCLSTYGYDYGWKLSPNDWGNWKILFLVYEDFYGLSELPEAMIDIWNGFRELNRRLEAELGLNRLAPICPFPPLWKPDNLILMETNQTEYKEAA